MRVEWWLARHLQLAEDASGRPGYAGHSRQVRRYHEAALIEARVPGPDLAIEEAPRGLLHRERSQSTAARSGVKSPAFRPLPEDQSEWSDAIPQYEPEEAALHSDDARCGGGPSTQARGRAPVHGLLRREEYQVPDRPGGAGQLRRQHHVRNEL